MAGELKDEQFVLTLLTAVIKREGGELRIPEDVMKEVTTSDLVTLAWDENTSEIVLKASPAMLNNIAGLTYDN